MARVKVELVRAGRLLEIAPPAPAEHVPRIERLLAARALLGHDPVVRQADGRRVGNRGRLRHRGSREMDGERGATERQRRESDPRKA